MTLEELAKLVRAMRQAQTRYFLGRDPADLRASKDAEYRVDQAVADVLAPPGLFEEGTPP